MANTVSENIRKLRIKKGISQDRLSKDALEKIVYPVVSQRIYFGTKALACPSEVLPRPSVAFSEEGTKAGRAGGRII